MSIIVKGMDIPKSCNECIKSGLSAVIKCDKWVNIGVNHRKTDRSFNCNLVELPRSHGYLVDGTEALKMVNIHGYSCLKCVFNGMCESTVRRLCESLTSNYVMMPENYDVYKETIKNIN